MLRGHARLVHLVGDLGDDDLLLLAAPGDFSTSMRARMMMVPRPVR